MPDAERLVILGYGNPARGDDALGPELLRLIEALKDARSDWDNIELITDFQLQIEHAVDLENRDLALFIDASVSVPAPYRFTRLQAERDTSYTSHAISPAAVLYVFEQINPRPAPPAYLLSIPGEDFELGQPMSRTAKKNLAAAFELAKTLCEQPESDLWEVYAHRSCEVPIRDNGN